MKYIKKIPFIFLFIPGILMAHLETVKHVNLEKYMGTWYEIALLPNRFEKKCIEGAIAHYSLMENGTVKVVNQCKTIKGLSTATGVAWVVDKTTQAKLKVSFVPLAKYFHWFGGDYWILYLDSEYQNVVVGSPDRKYLWFLSKTPSISEDTYNKLVKVAEDQGFSIESMIRLR
jgi:apolipoprotein D and lipocalin family protein